VVGGRLSGFVALVQLIAQAVQVKGLDGGLRSGGIEIVQVEIVDGIFPAEFVLVRRCRHCGFVAAGDEAGGRFQELVWWKEEG
jgi:hypothetical protein